MKQHLADRLRAVWHRLVPRRTVLQLAPASRFRWLSRRWRSILGWPGVAALGMLVSLLPFYLSAVRPLQAHLEEVRQSVSRQLRHDAHAGKQDGGLQGPDEQLDQYYRFFPPVRSAPQWLEKLVALAESCGLGIDQGEYQAAPDKVGRLVRFQMTLPVKGEYQQIRRFLAALPGEFPVVALEKVQFERQNIADPAVEARIGLVLFLGRPS
jgi:hypothetical protein